MRALSCLHAAALVALAAVPVACKPSPRVEKEAIPTASASPSGGSNPVVPRAAVDTVPSLVAEAYPAAKGRAVYPVEGALMVAEENRVGRLLDDHVEWLPTKIPKEQGGVGASIITSVVGVWPDAIDALYTSSNGRALMPTITPLTGKGTSWTFGQGGGIGSITGVTRAGDSTVVAGYSYEGSQIITLRGPKVPWHLRTAAEGGCKDGEVTGPGTHVAISPSAIQGTEAGTLLSIGRLCDRRAPAAEVWDKTGKSRIVDLAPWLKTTGYSRLLRGKGDEVFIDTHRFRPILRYHEGQVEPLPLLERPIVETFSSPAGELHASDGQAIHRFEGGRWILVGKLPGPGELHSFSMDKDVIWARSSEGLQKLRPGPAVEPPPACAAPFVYLYDTSNKNADDFTYPTTRKALATFPGVSDLGLVELKDSGPTSLGITVPSKAVGEAVIAHLKQAMKDEAPVLTCLEAPKKMRKIEIEPAGKK